MHNFLTDAGKVANAQAEGSISKECLSENAAIDFCNTPGGYCEMGRQLGLAFACMFVPSHGALRSCV